MSHLHLVLQEFHRNRTRTALSVATIACAFLLFGLTGSVRDTFLNADTSAHGALRLVTQSRHVVSSPLPVALQDRIAAVDGVVAHGHATWFGGFYQQPRQPVSAYAISDGYLDVYPELDVDPWALARFHAERTGILVGEAVAHRHQWRVGQTIPLSSTIFITPEGGRSWSFVIAGILRSRDPAAARFHANTVLFHWDYLASTSPYVQGRVGWYASRLANITLSDAVAGRIDALSANSADETRSLSEQAAFAAQVRELGDIEWITRSIMGAVLFSLLLTTASTLSQSLHERRSELAMYQALGFPLWRLAAMLVAESAALYLLGCILGLLAAAICIALSPILLGQLAGLRSASAHDWSIALGLATGLGAMVGAGAALRHLRRDVSATLAGR